MTEEEKSFLPSLALIELGAVVMALGLLARLAHRFGVSPIPLYLIVGLAFGTGGFFPIVETGDFLEIAAEVGVILLLLLLGLEYSAEELVHSLKSNSPAGFVDFFLNFTPGLITGLVLGWSAPVAMALGGVTYVSSSGVVAKTLSDLGRLGNKETPTILSILVFEDLAMALYLPVVTGLLLNNDLGTTIKLIAIAMLTLTVILLSALRLGGRYSRWIGTPNNEVLLLLILGTTFLVAGLAEELHVSAGVGAFLVGIAVSGPVAEGARALLTPLRDLFAAVFFVFFGLRTNPGDIPPVLIAAIILAVVTAITKFATGYWAASRQKDLDRSARKRAGAALIAHGEFSIVIAGLAVAGDATEIAPLAAAYVFILAVAGPIAARFIGSDRKKPKLSLPDD